MPIAPTSLLNRCLTRIERAGNRLPHPAVMFIWLSTLVLAMSAIAATFGSSATHPISGELIVANNLLNAQGIRRIFEFAVSNFTDFAPVGVVLIAMLGIGVAEHSGLLATLLTRLVRWAGPHRLAYAIAFAGVMSSIAADVGYVVLLPLAGMIYHAAGRPALAGIAVAFAGVSAGYSANLVIGPVDALLAGISTEAARFVDDSISVGATANYYFIVVSTIMITLVCGQLSNRLVEPRLRQQVEESCNNDENSTTNTTAGDTLDPTASDHRQSLRGFLLFSVLYIAALSAATFIDGAPFHHRGSDTAPLVRAIIPIVALYFALGGYVYGRCNGVYKSFADAIEGMESAMRTMAYYIVLMFFAAQFVNYFSWSNLGAITAIRGAEFLSTLSLGSTALMLSMVFFTALLNLLVGSASAKWAVLAPVFVPMFLLLGIPAENTQLAYRIGDSTTNIITPLMPYFGIALAYVQHYRPEAGMGSVIAMMLPYSLTLLVSWSTLCIVWLSLGLPLGP